MCCSVGVRRGGFFDGFRSHLSTGVEVFSMKLIIFSFTFTDLDLRANVILLTKDLTPLLSPGLLSDSPCIRGKNNHLFKEVQRYSTCPTWS